MKIDTAGNYTLRYTAEDECGNETVVDRSLVVAAPRTVLYTDGTFIINELAQDRARNEQLHGVVTNEYIPFDPNGSTNEEKYIFSPSAPWRSQAGNIMRVEIGSPLEPFSLQRWFTSFSQITTLDLSLIDFRNVSSLDHAFAQCSNLQQIVGDIRCHLTGNACESTFANCHNLQSVDLLGVDTSDVTSMKSMFYDCSAISKIDLSSFNTAKVTNMTNMFSLCRSVTEIDMSNSSSAVLRNFGEMFRTCPELVTIYANAAFDLSTKSLSTYVFDGDTKLVGGQGTAFVYGSSDYGRIDNPPDAPGYFTLKPTA